VPSHYNFTTPFDAALMRGGAAGTAGIFLVGVVVLLVAAARARGVAPPVRLGVLAGGGVLLVGCLVGLLMVVNNSGVYQGTVAAGFVERRTGYLGPDPTTVGPEYLLLRPATAGGDLVLPHAVGVHGLVLLAVPAVLLARTGLSDRSKRILQPAAPARATTARAHHAGDVRRRARHQLRDHHARPRRQEPQMTERPSRVSATRPPHLVAFRLSQLVRSAVVAASAPEGLAGSRLRRDGDASVHREDLPGDERGGHQVEVGVGHLVDCAEPAERHLGDEADAHRVELLARHRAPERGVHERGGDAVDPHGRAHLDGEPSH
jgi:hypothetical protein